MTSGQDGERGFTLLETLIAFVILSASLIAMYEIFTDGFRANVQADETRLALRHAENILAQARVELSLTGRLGEGEGELGSGFTWSARQQPMDLLSGDIHVKATWLEINVRGTRAGRSVTLETLVVTPDA